MALNKPNEILVDCPVCDGWGFHLKTNKLCRCSLEQSQGWTPGQLPESIAIEIKRRKAITGAAR